MSLSNYPPGMTSEDYDHVEGKTPDGHCAMCGGDLFLGQEVYPTLDGEHICPDCLPDYVDEFYGGDMDGYRSDFRPTEFRRGE